MILFIIVDSNLVRVFVIAIMIGFELFDENGLNGVIILDSRNRMFWLC
jgi:hypothetical protein